MPNSTDLWKQLETTVDEETMQGILDQIDQRARKGFSSTDASRASHHLIEVLPSILDHIATHTDVYPLEFNELDDWKNYLRGIADTFREAHRLEQEGNYKKADEVIAIAMRSMGDSFWDLWYKGDEV